MLQPKAAHAGFGQAARAVLGGDSALGYAAYLLHEVLQRELGGSFAAARNLWPALQTSLRQLCTRASVREALLQLAERLALPEPGQLVSQVLKAVRSELLVALHALLARSSESPDPIHRKFHEALFRSALAADGDALPLWTAVLRQQQLEEAHDQWAHRRYRDAADTLLACLRAAPTNEELAVAKELADCCLRALDGFDENDTAAIDDWISLMQTASTVCGASTELRSALAMLYCRLSVVRAQKCDDFRGAARNLAYAYALSPAAPEPPGMLTALATAVAEVQAQIDTALAEGAQLNENGRLLKWQLCDPRKVAIEFLESAQGKAALEQSLALQAQAEEMLLASGASEATQTASAAEIAALLATARQGLAAVSAGAKPPAALNAPEAQAWLFSRQDLWAKGLLISGLLLMLLGVYRTGQAAVSQQRRDRAYQSFVAALGRADDTNVVSTARAFLDNIAPSVSDGRTAAVAQACAQSLWHQVTQAADTGDANRAHHLATEAQELGRWLPAPQQEETP